MFHLFVAFLAFSWLLYRLVRFITIPVSSIVVTLGVKTPPTTKVSIDKITCDSITIHWENEPLNQDSKEVNTDSGNGYTNEYSICHYILYLNNKQIAVFHNSPNALYTCCAITGLEHGMEYQLDFVSVNKLGYVNKLPSIYCKTDAVTGNGIDKTDIIHNNEFNDQMDNSQKTTRWRRNTLVKKLTSTFSGDSSQSKITTDNYGLSVNGFNAGSNLQSYTSLTTLKDLENYTIDDLKKILVCSQEDLHDVLAQEKSISEDFQESQVQLQMELDNLKTSWSHEMNLRKSLKSSIKSLENSKLLTDTKSEKVKKKINELKFKISRMEKDMKEWEKENSLYHTADLGGKYDTMIKEIGDTELQLQQQVQNLQSEIQIGEANYKDIVSRKPILTKVKSKVGKETINSLSSDKQENALPIIRDLEFLLTDTSKLYQHNSKLASLSNDSKIMKFIKTQKSMDQKKDSKWKAKFEKIQTTIKELEGKLTEMESQKQGNDLNDEGNVYKISSSDNIQNYQNILAQNYQNISMNQKDTPQLLPNSKLSDGLEQVNSNGLSNDSPVLSNDIDMANQTPLILHHPASYNGLNPPINFQVMSPPNQVAYMNQETRQFSSGSNAVGSVMSAGAQSNHTNNSVWNNSYPYENAGNNLEYENTNHLLTGLEDMIHDEADYPESISNYSNVFTVDQLDNYWNKKRSIPLKSNAAHSTNTGVSNIHAAAEMLSPQASALSQSSQVDNKLGTSYSQDRIPLSSSPLGPYTHAHSSSLGVPQSHTQHLLSSSLNNSVLGKYQDQFGFQQGSNYYGNSRPLASNINGLSNGLPSPHQNENETGPVSFNFLPNYAHNDDILVNQVHLNNSFGVNDIGQHNINEEAFQNSRMVDNASNIWNTIQLDNDDPKSVSNMESKESSSTIHEPTTPKAHKRNQSNSSIASWTRLSWKSLTTSNPTSPQRGSIHEPALEEEDQRPNSQGHANGQERPTNGRKMSRLLSRSTMNNLFKKSTHDS